MNDTTQNTQAAGQQPSLSSVGQAFVGSGTTTDDATKKLNIFASVLDDIQNSVPHGVVRAVDQATDTLNQFGVTRTTKERAQASASNEAMPTDISGGVQTVEQEKNPEIPVEVESFLSRVEDHHETAPTEVVIADGTAEVPTTQYPSQPVIVLPLTEAESEEGLKKSPKFSLRWLAEFGQKIIRMFTGKVIYKQEERNA